MAYLAAQTFLHALPRPTYEQRRPPALEQYITRFQIDWQAKIFGLNTIHFYGLTINEPASQSHGPSS